MELNFGRYKSKTIQEVFDINQSYCKWLLTQEMILSSRPEIKQFLQDKFKDADLSYTMTWGKYKGKSIQHINQIDSQYIDWLLTNQYVKEKCLKLYDELINLKNQPKEV